MADYRVGIVDRPTVPLAVAVAASSAFPPFLSPLRLSLEEFDFRPDVPENAARIPRSLRAEAVLTDGGVYDNLGLEPVWKRYRTVLVSDGGRPAEDDLSPAEDWARHSRRLIDLLEHQVSKLRRRQAVNAFRDPAEPHLGTYWGIHTDMANYRLADGLPCPHAATMRIARIETRLSALSALEQERIMNWGYAICDASMRSFVDEFKHAQPPAGFPFPAAGVG
jgi:NTE family protein